MKINELEKILGVERANIRYYEKEGLLKPQRGDNGYRDYSEEDLKTLKEIIVFRKLGLSVAEIKQVLEGRLNLSEAMADNIESLESQLEKLIGAISMSREIQEKKLELSNFDADYYFEAVDSQEKTGHSFMSIYEDVLEASGAYLEVVQEEKNELYLKDAKERWHQYNLSGAMNNIYYLMIDGSDELNIQGHIHLIDADGTVYEPIYSDQAAEFTCGLFAIDMTGKKKLDIMLYATDDSGNILPYQVNANLNRLLYEGDEDVIYFDEPTDSISMEDPEIPEEAGLVETYRTWRDSLTKAESYPEAGIVNTLFQEVRDYNCIYNICKMDYEWMGTWKSGYVTCTAGYTSDGQAALNVLGNLDGDFIELFRKENLTEEDLTDFLAQIEDDQVSQIKEFYYADSIPEELLEFYDPNYGE